MVGVAVRITRFVARPDAPCTRLMASLFAPTRLMDEMMATSTGVIGVVAGTMSLIETALEPPHQ